MAAASHIRPVAPSQEQPPQVERWALINADGTHRVGSVTQVAGLPNVARLVRLAATAGLHGAVIQTADRAPIAAALRRWPAPAGFEIELATASPDQADRQYLELDGCAVFAAGELDAAEAAARPPLPLVTLASRVDARRATKELIARTKKSIDADGVVA